MSGLHVVMPAGVDDPQQASGGNYYDRRVCDGLRALGWSVHEHLVAGAGLGRVLAAVPDGELALVDGLVASGAPGAVSPHAERLRLVVLVHLPFGVDRPRDRAGELAVLSRCAAVVTTSSWTRSWLLAHYRLDPRRVHVVHPGVDPADAAAGGSWNKGRLLVVGRVTPAKGHDVLAGALAGLADLPWQCVCAGSLAADPKFVTNLRHFLLRTAISDRVELRGPLPTAELQRAYGAADLLVVPSRAETYGMVVTEGLAHGLPVVATCVGGVPEALGHARDGRRPGVLIPPGDPAALRSALRSWLTDPAQRARLRETALLRRPELAGWGQAAERLADVLVRVVPAERSARPSRVSRQGPSTTAGYKP